VRDSYLIPGLAGDGVRSTNAHYARHMKPPIYSSVQPDGMPAQHMHRARQFRRAAMQMADYGRLRERGAILAQVRAVDPRY
jgi:hypothetical protein